MTVGFPEWMGIYILIYSQTRNVWVLLKDVLGKIDMKKVNHGVIYLAYFGHHFNMTVKSYACPLHEARKTESQMTEATVFLQVATLGKKKKRREVPLGEGPGKKGAGRLPRAPEGRCERGKQGEDAPEERGSARLRG